MVNSVVDAITTQLGKTFGATYHYYFENVEQNLSTPCFTVDSLLPTQRARGPVMYDRTFPLVIHYFSDKKTNLKKDCYSVAEVACECLEYLPYEGTLLRGENVSWQVVDDVLQIFITYRFYTDKVLEPTPYMGDLDINGVRI